MTSERARPGIVAATEAWVRAGRPDRRKGVCETNRQALGARFVRALCPLEQYAPGVGRCCEPRREMRVLPDARAEGEHPAATERSFCLFSRCVYDDMRVTRGVF